LLQLEVIEETGTDWLLLKVGNTYIGLHKAGTAWQETGNDAAFEPNTKLVFETTRDINELRAQLLANNITIQSINQFEGDPFLRCDGEDPEGNVFQLKQRVQQ
jgi:hypothetical protein